MALSKYDDVLYPNGQLLAVAQYYKSGSLWIPWDGTVSGGGSGGGDIVLTDGIDNTIKATVRDFTNSNPLTVVLTDGSGNTIATLPISAASLPLPSGAATSAKQDTGNTSLASILSALDVALSTRASQTTVASILSALDVNLSTRASQTTLAAILALLPTSLSSNNLRVSLQESGITLAISAASLPLPTGAATSALQTTGNTSLSSIDGKITAVNTGAVVISSALPAGNNNIGDVDVASVPSDPFGTNADAASATGSISAKLRFIAATGIPITGTVTVTGNVGHGKTIKNASGSFTSDTDIVAAVTSKRIKVIAYAFFTFGTSATTLALKSNGAAGTELWRVALQSVSSQVMGANLSIAAPSFLFATVAGEKLTADTNTSDTIHYSLAYFDDDAT